jgi:hypothetical protein
MQAFIVTEDKGCYGVDFISVAHYKWLDAVEVYLIHGLLQIVQ